MEIEDETQKIPEVSLENYLKEAQEHYQRQMDAGCNGCGCKLMKMGFDDNFIIVTQLESDKLYEGLLKTKKFKRNNHAEDFRGQLHLVHIVGCTAVSIAETGKEWDFARSVGYQTDVVLGGLPKRIIIAERLSPDAVEGKSENFICEAKSTFLAVKDILKYAKKEQIPLICGFGKFGGFGKVPTRDYEAPKLVYYPK